MVKRRTKAEQRTNWPIHHSSETGIGYLENRTKETKNLPDFPGTNSSALEAQKDATEMSVEVCSCSVSLLGRAVDSWAFPQEQVNSAPRAY